MNFPVLCVSFANLSLQFLAFDLSGPDALDASTCVTFVWQPLALVQERSADGVRFPLADI